MPMGTIHVLKLSAVIYFVLLFSESGFVQAMYCYQCSYSYPMSASKPEGALKELYKYFDKEILNKHCMHRPRDFPVIKCPDEKNTCYNGSSLISASLSGTTFFIQTFERGCDKAIYLPIEYCATSHVKREKQMLYGYELTNISESFDRCSCYSPRCNRSPVLYGRLDFVIYCTLLCLWFMFGSTNII